MYVKDLFKYKLLINLFHGFCVLIFAELSNLLIE